MTEQKHTPGPWQIDEGGEVHKHGRTIFAWPELSGAPNEEIHANMRLGRAAPDLLEALKHARQNMPHPDQMIDDAIAKAEGRDDG